MMKAERQEQILRKIDANGRVVVTDYAKELGVTEATCFTVQFHPEAHGGPLDTAYLFDEFVAVMEKEKK